MGEKSNKNPKNTKKSLNILENQKIEKFLKCFRKFWESQNFFRIFTKTTLKTLVFSNFAEKLQKWAMWVNMQAQELETGCLTRTKPEFKVPKVIFSENCFFLLEKNCVKFRKCLQFFELCLKPCWTSPSFGTLESSTIIAKIRRKIPCTLLFSFANFSHILQIMRRGVRPKFRCKFLFFNLTFLQFSYHFQKFKKLQGPGNYPEPFLTFIVQSPINA